MNINLVKKNKFFPNRIFREPLRTGYWQLSIACNKPQSPRIASCSNGYSGGSDRPDSRFLFNRGTLTTCSSTLSFAVASTTERVIM